MFNSNTQQIIDAESLDYIPEKRRAKAESYTMPDSYYDEFDILNGDNVVEDIKCCDIISNYLRKKINFSIAVTLINRLNRLYKI